MTLLPRLRPLAAALALAVTGPTLAASLDLPDIGDSSAAALPAEEADRIGSDTLRQLRQAGKVVEEPGLKRYIEDLGHRLAAGGDDGRKLTFFIVDDPNINAFALPGGYIGVHTGLILATRNEDELAAVVAHEIAHVTQRHIERGLEEAGKMRLPLTAAMLAAIVLAGKNPQMGEAAIASSVAGVQQAQLNFTREHEQEADRIGMQMLAGTGLDPRSMPSFFERLKQESRYAASTLPSFLSTHPVTDDRIADTRARADQFGPVRRGDHAAYWIAKARLRVHTARDPRELAGRIGAELKSGSYDNLEGTRFAHALALSRTGEHAEARKLLGELLGKPPRRVAYLQAAAENELAAGDLKAAMNGYREGLALYPGNPELTLGYAELLLKEGDAAKARGLLEKLGGASDPEIFRLKARAAERLGESATAHFHQAEYYEAVGDLTSALQQLKLARKRSGEDFYLGSRIDAKLAQVEAADKERREQR